MGSLIVLRHGQADGNSTHRFIGHLPVELTATGRSQAERAAERLAQLEVTRIVSSDLVRCLDTARPLADRLDMEVETIADLREIDNGEWTGLEPREIAARWPDMWTDYVNGEDVPRPGGERWAAVAARVIPIAQEILDGDGTTVVSTHGGPSLIMAAWAAGLPIHGNIFRGPLGSLDNASLTMIDAGPRLLSFNDVGHLGRAGPDPRLAFEQI